MTNTRYLLGATEDREIVFAEFGITTRNGYPEFTACFNTVRPFTADELEDATEYYENLLDDCFDEAEKYRLCERWDCAPSELAEHLADEEGTDPMDIRDCSLYPEIIEVDGEDWYFESGSCGQHDTRQEMDEYTNKDAYKALHDLWDNYHLSKVGEDVQKAVEQIASQLYATDPEEWIADYIRRNF